MGRARASSARRWFAANVRAYRYERGLSQGRLAEAAKISRGEVQKIESARVDVGLDIIARLATALDVEIGALFAKARMGSRPVGAPRKQG